MLSCILFCESMHPLQNDRSPEDIYPREEEKCWNHKSNTLSKIPI